MSYYLICSCAHPMISTSAVGGAQCHRCGGWRSIPVVSYYQNFKVSDTPPRGPEEISGHPATAGPHNNKEIA